MVYKFFDKTSAKGSGVNVMSNQQLASETHKTIIRKLKKKEKYAFCLKTILGVHI